MKLQYASGGGSRMVSLHTFELLRNLIMLHCDICG